MGDDAPRPLRFFEVEETPDATRRSAAPASLATAEPRHGALDEGEPTEDPASDLRRRVAELRSVSRRGRHSERRPQDESSPPIEEGTPQEGVVEEFADRLSPHDPADRSIADVESDDDALSIAAFYERVRRALSVEFTEEIWVVGEIRGLREARGHRYLELADKGVESVGRGVAQQLEVVCWARDWPPIARALGEAGIDLEVGRVVRVRGKVSVWEGGSKLRFTLTALDIEALLGGIAAARRRLLAALAAEGLLEANRQRPLSLVPLRIGLVTSPGSEAHRDFVGQLERSGYAFVVKLAPTLVQGPEAPAQIAAALAHLSAFKPDLAVIVRGGGARGDLAAFDAEVVARAIAVAPFPVWTGIGHTSDRSVADEVAHHSLITPTACGEAVVEIVEAYWASVLRQMNVASQLARAHLDSARHRASANASALVRAARHQLTRRADGIRVMHLGIARAAHTAVDREVQAVTARAATLDSGSRRVLRRFEDELGRRQQVLRAYDPRRQLERGWTFTYGEDGHLVRSFSDVAAGGRLRTRFVDGEAISIVESVAGDEVVMTSTSDGNGVGE